MLLSLVGVLALTLAGWWLSRSSLIGRQLGTTMVVPSWRPISEERLSHHPARVNARTPTSDRSIAGPQPVRFGVASRVVEESKDTEPGRSADLRLSSRSRDAMRLSRRQ